MATADISDRINRLFEKEQWGKARALIEQELARKPDDPARHWLLTRLSTTYYEERDYVTALKWVWEAEKLAPDCPLVLWDLAGTLEMLGDKAGAAAIYEKLIARGAKAIATDECGEGDVWADALLTDCHYRAAGCYEAIGETKQAAGHLEAFRAGLKRGAESIYSDEDAYALEVRLSVGDDIRALADRVVKYIRSVPRAKAIPAIRVVNKLIHDRLTDTLEAAERTLVGTEFDGPSGGDRAGSLPLPSARG